MKKVFFFHYNKPESRRLRKPKMSVHFNKTCYIVDHVDCQVGSYTVHRKRQPFCVMKGKCFGVTLVEDPKTKLVKAIIL